jgi:hypothetical protein
LAQGCVVPRIEILTYFVYAPFSIHGTPCPEPKPERSETRLVFQIYYSIRSDFEVAHAVASNKIEYPKKRFRF